jgi:hypothetical protein
LARVPSGGQIVTAPRVHGVKQNEDYLRHPDKGCEFSNGKKCIECPFEICVKG